MTRSVGLCTMLIALGGSAFACASMQDASFGAENDPSGGTAADGGMKGSDLGPSAATPGPVDNAVILVHAAKSQSFRLCFKNELDRRPQPDSDIMPEANVVGVEVGSAVRLGPLRGAPGEIFLFDEPLIRAFYPQFGGAGTGPTCGALLSSSNEISKLAVNLGTIDKSLATGVHLLVVRGCPGNGPLRSYSVGECGGDWTALKGNLGISEIELSGAERPKTGTLPAQVVNLSQPLDGTRAGRDVVISFGDLAGTNAKLVTVTSNPPLFGAAAPAQPAQLTYPADDPAIFGTSGFRISLASKGADAGQTTVLDQTLERVQELSAPRDVPPTYYAAASNYALLLLGDPGAKLGDGGVDTDDRRRLHLLAVPVIETKSSADGGSGSPLDGGAAPSP